MRGFKTVFVFTIITMVFAGIRRQMSRVEKDEFVIGVAMEFFEAKFGLGAGECVISAGKKMWLILEPGDLRAR